MNKEIEICSIEMKILKKMINDRGKKGPNLCRQAFLGSMKKSQAAREEEEELLDRVILGGEKVANDGDKELGDALAVGGAQFPSSRLQSSRRSPQTCSLPMLLWSCWWERERERRFGKKLIMGVVGRKQESLKKLCGCVSPLFLEAAGGALRMESEGGSLKFDRDWREKVWKW